MMSPPIGRYAFQLRWVIVLLWLVAAAGLAIFVPSGPANLGENGDLLPSDTPVHQALAELSRHFGTRSNLSDAVIVFEKSDGPLSPDDLADVEETARLISHPVADDKVSDTLRAAPIQTPAALAIGGRNNPLISADGRAALIVIGLPFNFISVEAGQIVQHIQSIVESRPLPAGVTAAVTGSAGYGYDYAVAIERSHQRTLVVTLIAVIVILLLIYRAPVAALIPLSAIGLAAIVVMKLLSISSRFGMQSGTAEQIFTFVLLYGAGVDYSLLFMSRYRECLAGEPARPAMIAALNASLPSIVSSALVTMCGLVMMCAARFSVFRHAGPAVVLAIAVAAISASTLVPAVVAILGPRIFWPQKANQTGARRSSIWPTIARRVIHAPVRTLAITLLLLFIPAFGATRIQWNYDSLYSLKSIYSAVRGTQIVQRHWPTGEAAPVALLAISDSVADPPKWTSTSADLETALRGIADVDNVRSLNSPLGWHVDAAANAAVGMLGKAKVEAEYLSPDGKAARLNVILKVLPLGRGAMEDVRRIQRVAQSAVKPGIKIVVAGATAEMIDIRTITQQDFRRVAALALIAILLILSAALRDVALSVFIVAATALSYLTTLGLTNWFFMRLGASGLEWKVQMLLFIVLVAVGQDYSIFFALRFEQEKRRFPVDEATRRAVISTGPVISSCGLIMAATLGSVMAGDISLLIQLGFAFALGMLIDTFVVRPLLLPAFIVLTHRQRGDLRPDSRLSPSSP